MKASFAILLLSALAFSYNHPEIKWNSVSTEHFIINFYDRTEPAVYATWKIAEEAFQALAAEYDYQGSKISISLAEYDDYSNGWADWTAGNIMIWVPDARFDLRGNNTWLRNVITHELAHILSLQKKKRLQMLDLTVNLQMQTPSESFSWQEPFPRVTLLPAWLTEGIAQLESQALGNDCWDSRREMVLRTAILQNRALSLDEMGHFNHDAIGNELVYNQGFAFVKHIERAIGTSRLHGMFRQGNIEKISFPTLFTRTTGALPELAYTRWIDSLKSVYHKSVPAHPTAETYIWSTGKHNFKPRISSNGQYRGWLTDNGDDGGRTDLVIAETASGRVVHRVRYAHTTWDFAPSSDLVYYVKSRDPNRDGSFFNDLFSFDLRTRRSRRLTRDARVYELAVSPDGREIACVRYHDGAYSLEMYRVDNGSFTRILEGTRGEPFMHVAYPPTGNDQLAVTKIVAGRSRLFLFTKQDTGLKEIGAASGGEETPMWAADGRIYFSADYDRMFNVYSVAPDGSDMKRHTSVTGGLFSPFVAQDGSILCSSYNNRFAIVKVTPTAEPWEFAPDSADQCTFKPLPTPRGKVTIKSRAYDSKLLRAVWAMQIFGGLARNASLMIDRDDTVIDTTGWEIGASMFTSRGDAVGKRSRYMGVILGALGSMGSDTAAQELTGQRQALPRPSNPEMDKLRSSASFALERNRIAGKVPYAPNRDRNKTWVAREVAAIDETDTADDSTSGPGLMAIAVPVFGFQNRKGTPTTGIELQAQVVLPMIPAIISALPYAQWNVTRDISAGLNAEIHLLPFAGPAVFGALPLFVDWQRIGKYNEDLGYNLADYTQLLLAGGPQFFPAQRLTADYDTTDFVPSGLVGGLDFIHGIPLAKYMSLTIATSHAVSFYNRPVLDPLAFFNTNSRLYLTSLGSLSLQFPIVRTINKRLLGYADALYGDIGYTLWLRGNKGLFYNDTLSSRILTDTDYLRSNAVVGHFLSGAVRLGHYKAYSYFRSFSIRVTYEMLREQTYLDLQMGF